MRSVKGLTNRYKNFDIKNDYACAALALNLHLTMINECIYSGTLMVRVNELKFSDFDISNEACI